MTEAIATLHAFIASPMGISLIAMLGTWVAGNGIKNLLAWPFTQRIMGAGLLTAKAPAMAVAKLSNVPPLKYLIGPFACILIFGGFWFFTFMDTLLNALSPDVRSVADSLEKMLARLGSTDRQLYIMAKGMTQDQVAAVTKMAEAVKAPESLDSFQRHALNTALAAGNQLQADRLGEVTNPGGPASKIP